MTQQAALRIAADLSGVKSVAFHPKCHVAVDEGDAYKFLHHLTGLPLTREARQPSAEDFRALEDPVGILLIELPLRRVDYALSEWTDLVDLTEAGRGMRAWIHLDGARLWECGPFYGRSASEIAALSDSVACTYLFTKD